MAFFAIVPAMAELRLHAESRCPAVRGVEASVQRDGDVIRAVYVLRASLQDVRIPAPREPRFADGLWRRTCCEMFIARPESPAYHEFNFSPSGEWALYAFSAYRDGGPLSQPVPMIRTQRSEEAFRLEAEVRWPPGTLLLGLSAVVEAMDGTLSYWALRHPPGKPDFHHRGAFALELG
jgi:hypothetical protein